MDIVGELSGAYDATRAVDGVDPSTNEKVGWFDRSVAGVMVVGSMLQVGKLGKIPKVAKTLDKANTAKKEMQEAEALFKAKRQKQAAINRTSGDKFEAELKSSLEDTGEYQTVVKQLTLETPSGIKTRVDLAAIGKENSKINLYEAKASLTAPLTKNQKAAFPEIEKYGAIVKGKGKPPLVGGTEIPPSKVEVVRKQ
ncbi:pre-toxin TG domain-containing protein [Bacillus pacificus]|uniref:pre-toxin TG domain-containing protein n=1 Tax=Bacillus pacificus TaxID=2026187 RepID=UPI002967328C|nr:pre-toxin TG domain-containing protein [Bacillus pacificus]MDW3034757.1 pre-toxin TG domain-containing protein [Bacillus pacificus]